MRTKLLFFIFAFALSSVVYAQDRPNREQRQGQGQRISTEERAKNQADRLKKELTLTDVQYDSVKAIQLRHLKKMEEAFKDQSSDRRAAFQKSQEELGKELKVIFTADQVKKYDEMLKERENRRGRNRDGQRPQRNN